MKILALLAAAAGCALAQTPGIDEIMARVAANQAKSLAARRDYVYDQEQLLRMTRGSGKLAREERRNYVVSPSGRRAQKQLISFAGKYEAGKGFVSYQSPGYRYKGMDIDGDLMQEFADETDDSHSRDGISPDLFPLTAKEQRHYNYHFKGTAMEQGRPVFRIAFEPKVRQKGMDMDDGGAWKGEALIDAAEFQPVRVVTDLAWKMPLAVKTLLGTNVKGVGFSIAYQRFGDGVWFPVSYGGEFEIRAVFFYQRRISISLRNSGFRRTDVSSTVAYVTDK